MNKPELHKSLSFSTSSYLQQPNTQSQIQHTLQNTIEKLESDNSVLTNTIEDLRKLI